MVQADARAREKQPENASLLSENQIVEYDLVENRGKTSAENLKVS